MCTAPTTSTPPVPQNLNDRSSAKGRRRLTNNKSIQRKEEKRHSSQKVQGRTELDLVLDEVERSLEEAHKRSLEEAHLEVQAAQNKAIEAAFRVGQTMGKMSRITKLLEGNLEPAGQ